MSQVPRIYHADSLKVGTQITLEEQASRHVLKVLRLHPGADLTLFDGRGGEYQARLTDGGPRQAVVEITSFANTERESRLDIHLAQVIARGERMDQIIQKAVELGVHRITPLTSARCGVRLEPAKAEKRMAHWRGVIVSACEQSGRNRLPAINDCVDILLWLQAMSEDKGTKLILHPEANVRLSELTPPGGVQVTLLIGPEGGLSPAEVATARKLGFSAVQLGPRILRTETAGMTAVATLQALWGDFC